MLGEDVVVFVAGGEGTAVDANEVFGVNDGRINLLARPMGDVVAIVANHQIGIEQEAGKWVLRPLPSGNRQYDKYHADCD